MGTIFENKIIQALTNLSNALVGITLLCYITGFAITNLYLGSLGIVNLDIVRSRYILTGLLFTIFIGLLGFLFYGFRKILVENYDASPMAIIKKVFTYSLRNIITIYFVVPAIAIFAGTATTIPPVMPEANSSVDWREWMITEPVKAINLTSGLVVMMVLLLIILLVLLFIINPKNKDGARPPRKEMVIKMLNALKEGYLKFALYALLFFILLFVTIMFGSMLTQLQTNINNSNTTRESFFQIGWSRFFNTIMALYGFLALFLLLMFFTQRNTENDKKDNEGEDIVNYYFSWAYLIGLLIAIVIPAYAFGVYQYLPQQIGGGRLIPVEATSSSAEINSIFAVQTNQTYLIDRAPNNSLFLIVDQSTNNYKIIEVSADLIESIVFYESP